MIWYICMAVVFLFAGIGVKWAVDRIFGAQIHMVMPPRHAAPDRPARRAAEFDDTMDAIGAGFAAGERSALSRPARPGSTLERLGLPAQAALLGNGWHGGPYPDGPPAEQPDWPDGSPRVQDGTWHPEGTPQ